MKKLFVLLFISIGLSARIWREVIDGVELLRQRSDILMDGGLEEQIAFNNRYEELLQQKNVIEWEWRKGKLTPVVFLNK